MAVRLVILDLDRTLWDHHNATELRAPFTRIDEQTVADATGVHVTLQPGARPRLATHRGRRKWRPPGGWTLPTPASPTSETAGRPHSSRPPIGQPHPHTPG